MDTNKIIFLKDIENIRPKEMLTQVDVDLKKNENDEFLFFPSGAIYKNIKFERKNKNKIFVFETQSIFINCKFNNTIIFRENCMFINCVFNGSNCRFGNNCIFYDHAVFKEFVEEKDGYYFGSSCIFNCKIEISYAIFSSGTIFSEYVKCKKCKIAPFSIFMKDREFVDCSIKD